VGNYISGLSASERSLQARMAASAKHAKTDGQEATAAARAASPGSDQYWIDRVDPKRELTRTERVKRARNAKREHFTRMALKSAKARAARRADAARQTGRGS
jgi:hypothetical protein